MRSASDVLNFEIPLHWKSVRVKEQHFDWHKSPPKYARDRDLISGAKIYRWVFFKHDGDIEIVYIGQTEKFEERVAAYRKASQDPDTNDRFQAEVRRCEKDGGKVELQFLDLDVCSFRINGKLVTNSSLGDHDARLMMESIAIVGARASNVRVLNQLQENIYVKSLRRLIEQDPKVIDVIKRYIGE